MTRCTVYGQAQTPTSIHVDNLTESERMSVAEVLALLEGFLHRIQAIQNHVQSAKK